MQVQVYFSENVLTPMKRLVQRSSGQLGAIPWRIVGWNPTGPEEIRTMQ